MNTYYLKWFFLNYRFDFYCSGLWKFLGVLAYQLKACTNIMKNKKSEDIQQFLLWGGPGPCKYETFKILFFDLIICLLNEK